MPGSDGMVKFLTYLPLVLLVLGVIFTIFGDFTKDYIVGNLPLIIGVIVSFIIQEILASRVKVKKVEKAEK